MVKEKRRKQHIRQFRLTLYAGIAAFLAHECLPVTAFHVSQSNRFGGPLGREKSLTHSSSYVRLSLQTTSAVEEGLPEAMNVPLPPQTFAGQVETALKQEFGEENILRVLQSWRLLEADYIHDIALDGDNSSISEASGDSGSWRRQYCHSYVPGLTIKEFWDVMDFGWAATLSSKYKKIREEFQRVALKNPDGLRKKGNNIWSGALTTEASAYGEDWKTLVLKDRGVWDPVNANLFPVTSQIIEDAKIPAVEAFFASMQPNSKIEPHTDFTNFVLTSHLALQIPYSGQNMCRLRIGDTTRQWKDGEVMVFDTSLTHDAINESDQTRYILMLRVFHPDLTDTECRALQRLWDCLEIPDLISADPDQRAKALALADSRKELPKLSRKRGFGSSGFAGGKASGGRKKSKK